MAVKAKNEADIEKRFTALSKTITDSGGRVVDVTGSRIALADSVLRSILTEPTP